MTSEIRVNKITHTAGVGTVTTNTHGIVVSGIVTATTFKGNVEATTGSFSGNLGVGGVLTYEDVTNVDAVGVLTARSGIRIGTGGTVGPSGSGIVTYFGDGSQLTGLVSLANGADNRVITASSASALNGEANLTFDGNDLTVTGTAPAINFIDTDADDYKIHNVQGLLKVTDTTASADRFVINDNGTGYFLSNFQIGSTTSSPGATLHIKTSYPSLKVDSGGHASDAYVRIIAGNAQNSRVDFGDSDDDNIGIIDYDHANNSMRFFTNTSEKLRIESGGDVSIGNVDANTFSNYRTLTIGGAGAVDGAGIDLERSDGNIYGRLFADANGLQIGAPASGDYIRFETQNTERARITSDGFVGIGEDDPQTKLVVKGTIASGRNVARELGTVINTSVQYNGTRAGTNVINGNKNYEAGFDWLTPGGSRVNANLTIDLGTAINCDRFVIYNQNEYQDSKREVKNFTLEGSNDNSNWTTILDDDCGSSGAHEPNPGFSFRMPASYYDDNEGVSYRYWRFTMKTFHGSDSHGGVMELELWENDTTIHGTSEMCTSSVVAGDMTAETLQGIKRLYASKGMNIYTAGLTDTWEITEYGIVPSGSYQDKSTIRHKRGVMAVSSSYNSGDLFIRVDNLYNLDSNNWWVFGMLILSNEIQGGQGGGHHYVTSLQLMGLAAWNSVSTQNIVGSMSVSVNQSGSNYVELFVNVNDSSRGPCTVICNGGTFDPPRISFH